MNTWIVVAHRGGARLLRQKADDKMQVIETIDNPEGRLHDRGSTPGQPPSSRAGRASEPRDASRTHAAKTFATELARRLQKARTDNLCNELVLIAAPSFLGMLRAALDHATAGIVRGTLDKDYAGLSDHELIERLEKM